MPLTESIRSSNSGASNLSEPLYQVRLLSALRSGNPALIHPFIAEIVKDQRASVGDKLDTGAAALHLAVRCASVETVTLLLSHRAISPNGIHPPGSGTTALHLAASLGRTDIVNTLLEQDGIDDTLRDGQRRTCREVAKGKDVVKAIEDSHSFLNASYRSLLRSYILSSHSENPSPAFISLLESPRIKFVNLSYLDDGSGQSLLHEAARRKDFRLIELAIRAGADVFVRNRRGKTAYDKTGTDDRVRVFLRQFANHDTTLIETPISEPPSLRGYLNKYTNVAKGYNTRWFVLRNGILSYYRHQEDEKIASRGSISMKTAILKPSSTDRQRFEVHSTPSKGHQSVQRWYMKANHHVEASRWIQAIEHSIKWYKRQSSQEGAVTDGDVSVPRRSLESDEGSKLVRSQSHRLTGLLLGRGMSKSTAGSDRESASSFRVGNESDALVQGVEREDGVGGDGDEECDDGEIDDVPRDSSSMDSGSKVPPHEAGFELHGNSVAAQMDLAMQLLNNLVTPVEGNKEKDLDVAMKESFTVVQSMLNEYVEMAQEREAWWKKQLEREQKKQKFWEESFAVVVREGESLEKELRIRSRRRGSRTFEASIDGGSLRKRPLIMVPQNRKTIQEEYFPDQTPATPTLGEKKPILPPTPSITLDTTTSTTPSVISSIATSPSPFTPASGSVKLCNEAEEVDTDEEDEFFDAIESGTLPNLIMPDELVTSTHDLSKLMGLLNTAPYEGYRNLRLSLDLGEERPRTSLWSVLKHSIGKDLTKISFPVFFNEPTSMLQRMAEDMEFSECLDAAVTQKDPLRRLAFVAAFAMSNYSSTIGRIAKPFNPMLSETFEYVRFDKEYRYMSEQVSHHPPISACWAESSAWHYYGEVDAQNRFMGKSFEIRPTGIAHVELIIPEERGPGYPKAPGRFGKGKVVEHYTWKKVTTNVSGFILGSPTIDHYGDMIITNHRTNDQCILTFKPRGWRGKDAYEIAGQVIDSSGQVAYDIAGRWNSQLIASPASNNPSRLSLDPDMQINSRRSPSPPSSSSLSSPPFVLWRNSEKPVGTPFNLTPFAVTLNDCPDVLKRYLCPTDCRLRPDQRAFEVGMYEAANELKRLQEDKQRWIRKAREEGRMGAHRPRWFMAETDGDTGERVWAPMRVGDALEYWVERERVWREGGGNEWKDVDKIFIDEREGSIL